MVSKQDYLSLCSGECVSVLEIGRRTPLGANYAVYESQRISVILLPGRLRCKPLAKPPSLAAAHRQRRSNAAAARCGPGPGWGVGRRWSGRLHRGREKNSLPDPYIAIRRCASEDHARHRHHHRHQPRPVSPSHVVPGDRVAACMQPNSGGCGPARLPSSARRCARDKNALPAARVARHGARDDHNGNPRESSDVALRAMRISQRHQCMAPHRADLACGAHAPGDPDHPRPVLQFDDDRQHGPPGTARCWRCDHQQTPAAWDGFRRG